MFCTIVGAMERETKSFLHGIHMHPYIPSSRAPAAHPVTISTPRARLTVQGHVAKPALEKVGPPDSQACARNVAFHFSLCICPGPGMLIVRVGNSFWTQAEATGHHCGDITSRGFKLQDSDSSQRQAPGPLSEGLGSLM